MPCMLLLNPLPKCYLLMQSLNPASPFYETTISAGQLLQLYNSLVLHCDSLLYPAPHMLRLFPAPHVSTVSICSHKYSWWSSLKIKYEWLRRYRACLLFFVKWREVFWRELKGIYVNKRELDRKVMENLIMKSLSLAFSSREKVCVTYSNSIIFVTYSTDIWK